jgi:hypothetical protein
MSSERTTTAFATVMPYVLRQVWTEIEYCLEVCCVKNGANTEAY